MTLQEMQEELARQQQELREHQAKVIAPAKVAVEESAKQIEQARALHVSSNQEHVKAITTLEAAHETANQKQSAIHALMSKIQQIHGSEALKKVVTTAVKVGEVAIETADAGVSQE